MFCTAYENCLIEICSQKGFCVRVSRGLEGWALFLFFVFDELFAKSIASEVDALLEGLALFFGYEVAVGDSERDLGDFVFCVVSFVEAENDLGGEDAVEEMVEFSYFLVSEVLELLRRVEVD